jgi:hypothetical protein
MRDEPARSSVSKSPSAQTGAVSTALVATRTRTSNRGDGGLDGRHNKRHTALYVRMPYILQNRLAATTAVTISTGPQ